MVLGPAARAVCFDGYQNVRERMLGFDDEHDAVLAQRVGLAGLLVRDPVVISHADSSRIVSVTRLRMLAMAVGSSRSVIEIATRGSPSRLRAFWDCGDVRVAICSSSSPIHTGTVCGAPSARSVAMCAMPAGHTYQVRAGSSDYLVVKVRHARCRDGFDEVELHVIGQRSEERQSGAQQNGNLVQDHLVDEPRFQR